MPIANDIIIPMCVVCWYATHYIPGVQTTLMWTPVKCVWQVLLALFRTHAVCNMVAMAHQTLLPGAYYPIPLMGPILAGTVLGAAGMFIPFDKGMTPVTNGSPWPLQGAFMAATFYHLMVNDTTGFMGNALRSLIGTYSEDSVKVAIGTMHICTNLAQTLFHPDANLFTPIHKFLYLIFQVDGPSGADQKEGTVGWEYRTRIVLERWIELSRVLTVIAVILLHVYITQPPSILNAGSNMQVGSSGTLGNCQMLGSMRPCTPFILSLNAKKSTPTSLDYDYSMVSSKGFKDSVNATQVWTLPLTPLKKLKVQTNPENVSLSLGNDAVLRLVTSNVADKTEEILWSSKAICPTKAASSTAGAGKIFLDINKDTGIPEVHCADGTVAKLS